MDLRKILDDVANGRIDPAAAEAAFQDSVARATLDVGPSHIDVGRGVRTGRPEVIFCQGKQPEHVAEIVAAMASRNLRVLATRADLRTRDAVLHKVPGAVYRETARCILVEPHGAENSPAPDGRVAVVCAGTSDLPVAEEARTVSEFYGNPTDLVTDVGVAGIHRLYEHLPVIQAARAVVVVAGMEGALPSVVAGLIDKPVIAVPTSVGYGANFGGLAALLAMLNSCASGIAVVNIDNGFGAAVMASLINHG